MTQEAEIRIDSGRSATHQPSLCVLGPGGTRLRVAIFALRVCAAPTHRRDSLPVAQVLRRRARRLGVSLSGPCSASLRGRTSRLAQPLLTYTKMGVGADGRTTSYAAPSLTEAVRATGHPNPVQKSLVVTHPMSWWQLNRLAQRPGGPSS